eukprot:7496067-Alexandrium_andersonii.AAC.1
MFRVAERAVWPGGRVGTATFGSKYRTLTRGSSGRAGRIQSEGQQRMQRFKQFLVSSRARQ